MYKYMQANVYRVYIPFREMTGAMSKEGTRTEWDSRGLSLDTYCFYFFTERIYLPLKLKLTNTLKNFKQEQQCLLLLELGDLLF